MSFNYTKKIFKHSLVYGSGELFVKIIGFILIPIYTHHLNPDEYGALQLLVITANLITLILQFGLGSALFKSIIYNPKTEKSEIYSTALFLIGITSSIFLTVIYFNSNLISQILFNSNLFAYPLKLYCFIILIKNISIIALTKLRIENKSLQFSIVLFLQFSLQLLLNIYFVVFAKQGIIGIIYAELLTSCIFIFVFLAILWKELAWNFSKYELKDMLEYGLPIIPGNIAMFVLNMSNRYFLKHYTSMEDVGLFSLAYRFGMVVYLVIFAFQRAWASMMFTIAKEKGAKNIFAVNFTYFIFISGIIATVISIFSKEILQIMTTENYFPAHKIVPFFCFSNLFYGVFFYTAVGINIKKKTYYQTIAVIAGSILCVILNFLLIPTFNITGAALANMISFIVMASIAGIISNRLYPIPYEFKKIAMIGIIFIILLFICLNINVVNVILSILIKCILSFCVFIITFKFVIKSNIDLRKLLIRNTTE